MQLPAWINDEPENHRGLLVELHWLRRRGVWGLRGTSAPISQLLMLSSRTAGKNRSQYEAVLRLMTTVLSEHHLDERDSAAAKLYFGLTPETQTATEHSRREKTASRVFHQSISAFRNPSNGHERPFLVRLATTLTRLDSSDVTRYQSTTSTTYIPRLQYHATFNAALEQGETVIALVGEPGTGKSRLAVELVARHSAEGARTLVLSAHSEPRLKSDVFDELDSHGKAPLATQPPFDNALRCSYTAYICSEDAPEFMIIDNLADAEHLDWLIPTKIRPIVIITSRSAVLDDRDGCSITVVEMELDEARAFVHVLLPSLDEPNIDTLATTLGRRPLAIEHACSGLLADGRMSVDKFNRALLDRAAVTMTNASRNPQGSLPIIYREILERLYECDANYGTRTIDVLEFMVFLGPEAVPHSLLIDASRAVNSQDATNEIAIVLLWSALRELEKLHILRTRGNTYSLHPLTHAIIRDLLLDRRSVVCKVLLTSIEKALEAYSPVEPGSPVDPRVERVLTHTEHVLGGVAQLDKIEIPWESVCNTTVMYMHAAFETGHLWRFQEESFKQVSSVYIQQLNKNPEYVRSDRIAILWDYLYRRGSISRSAQVTHMAVANNSVKRVLDQGSSDLPDTVLDGPSVIRLVEATMMAYRHDLAEKLLGKSQSKQKKRDKRSVGLPWRADLLRLVADLHSINGFWKTAEASYQEALRSYKLGVGDTRCIRGQVRTLVSMAEMAIECGKVEPAKDWLHQARQLLGQSSDDFNDGISAASIGRVDFHAMVVDAVRCRIDGADHTQASPVLEASGSAIDRFRSANLYGRERYMLTHHYMHLMLLIDLHDVADLCLVRVRPKVQKIGETDLLAMFHLSGIKSKVLSGDASLKDIGRCLRIGKTLRGVCRAPNRHADALLTAYTIARQHKATLSVTRTLLKSTTEAHQTVGKQWKIALIEQALDENSSPFGILLP